MIDFKVNKALLNELEKHFSICSDEYIPALSSYVDVSKYARKIYNKAYRFEAWHGRELIGLLAVYKNEISKIAFITNVSTSPDFFGKKIGLKLLEQCMHYFKNEDYKRVDLEVFKINARALNFYSKNGFIIKEEENKKLKMSLELNRDYNAELKDTTDHKYAYNFDFDIMHHYMIRSFEPFFNKGKCLELGSFKGAFTKRLSPYFEHITCVEASNEAIAEAKLDLDKKIHIINDLFEEVDLPEKYDNIVLTHVLEHLDDPVKVLKRINDEWLSDIGRFFLVCPNANAPSRQIAVKMGLISHNTAVTPAEEKHGHRITYSLDTLERDARKAGLKVVHRSGIFFKALANFQWDRLLQTDIISKEYLEGCFQLGQMYPDLCSSIFLMCEKGDSSE